MTLKESMRRRIEECKTMGRLYAASDAERLITEFAGLVDKTYDELSEEIAFNYAAYGLPIVYLTGDTTGMDKDNAVQMQYAYGDMSGECEVKWQGTSSLNYPKKNYTIKFDNAFEAVEGWGEQKKYCLKAYYIDYSHLRDRLGAII